MLFNKTLKLLICFVMIFPYLLYGSGQTSAASNYNHAELMDYEGYGQAMYESIVEQTTFITGEYSDNKQYVNDSIDQIKDYAKFWWEENKVEGEGVGEKLKDVFVKGAAYTLTVGDWVKNLFTDYGEEYHPVEIDNDIYKSFVSVKPGTSNTFIVNPGYLMTISDVIFFNNDMGYRHFGVIFSNYNDQSATVAMAIDNVKYFDYKDFYGSDAKFFVNYNAGGNFTNVVLMLNKLGQTVEFETLQGEPVEPIPIERDDTFEKFKRYIDDSIDSRPIVVPQLKPSLTCPSGEKINLTVDGSTFLNKDGSVMLVNKDGTATVNGTSCALQWQTPEIGYVDDKTAITDPQGNWLDAITGEVLECVLEGGCKPAIPGDEDEGKEVGELDKGLLVYLKNAYEYATGVLKTATDGLKSLATGAKDLTALFGTFFSWLPGEMVVLMSSGLGIAIGLRLFRK